MGDHRDPAGPARGTGHGGQADLPPHRQDPGRGRAGTASRRDRGDLHRGRTAVRRVHRGRRQTRPPEPGGQRRPGPFRPGGTAVRRRTRRRHDRLGGENVFPGEVEDLLGRHPDVAEAAVVGVEDADFGQRLAAYVVREPGASVDEEDVKRYVKENLARYKVPRDVHFVDELPRTSSGKVKARALPD
ncbi:AMP-binding enzyme [Actinomadura keratinilytica]|uniref:AMP-binding enzyme n=1 Tax=Actinomadura keratinilytica TaxID=547461 RepID=UPI00362391F3